MAVYLHFTQTKKPNNTPILEYYVTHVELDETTFFIFYYSGADSPTILQVLKLAKVKLEVLVASCFTCAAEASLISCMRRKTDMHCLCDTITLP